MTERVKADTSMRMLIDGEDETPDEIADLAAELLTEAVPVLEVDADLSQLSASDFLKTRPSAVHPGSRYPMQRWQIQAHAYRKQAAGKMGLFAGLFSGETERIQAGVVHDAKRFSIVKSKVYGAVEVGVAVRLSVATDTFSGNVALTLPNLAAEAQLGRTDTRIGITVIGYAGPLGELLPAPKTLDVDTCVEYINAFRKIQHKILGQEGQEWVRITPLSYELPLSEIEAPPDASGSADDGRQRV